MAILSLASRNILLLLKMGTWTICYFGLSIKHVAVSFQHGPISLYIELEGPSIAKFDSISHGIAFGRLSSIALGILRSQLLICV